jgi:TRAP-type C4-dicarboxylate transport system permease small subunit
VVFADVASRELTGTGLHWARQAGVYANLFVVMLGLGIASASGAHLRPRFADHWLPAAWEPFVERARDGLMALFCLCFAAVAIGVVGDSYALGERSAGLGVLIWPFQAVIPAVFLIAAFRHGVFCAFPAIRPPDPVSDHGGSEPVV